METSKCCCMLRLSAMSRDASGIIARYPGLLKPFMLIHGLRNGCIFASPIFMFKTFYHNAGNTCLLTLLGRLICVSPEYGHLHQKHLWPLLFFVVLLIERLVYRLRALMVCCVCCLVND